MGKTKTKIKKPVVFPWEPEIDQNDHCNLLCVVTRRVSLKQWGIDAAIPLGFKSDGMTIPRFFWRFIGPKVEGKTVCPGIVHDWLYTSQVMSRADADEWLRLACIANGMSALKARLVWAGVRMGGKSHWK